jgi:hypothetical protein
MTLPNAYSWSPIGERLHVPYEAPGGRRVNAVGALFHGSRRFEFWTRARVLKTKRKVVPKRATGLQESELGVLSAELVIDFIWQIAGRPKDAPEDWRREKPLVVVLDNYSVHVGKAFQEARVKWRVANIELFYLPSYSPELSAIEPVWQDVKQHRVRRLSHETLLGLKQDLDFTLAAKARTLLSDKSLTATA